MSLGPRAENWYRCATPPTCAIVHDSKGDVYPATEQGKKDCEEHCVSAATAVVVLFGGLLVLCLLACLLYAFVKAPNGSGAWGVGVTLEAMAKMTGFMARKTQDALR